MNTATAPIIVATHAFADDAAFAEDGCVVEPEGVDPADAPAEAPVAAALAAAVEPARKSVFWRGAVAVRIWASIERKESGRSAPGVLATDEKPGLFIMKARGSAQAL